MRFEDFPFIFDSKNGLVFAWEQAPEFPDPVHFPTYGRMEDGRFTPTRWGVLEWTEETIERLDREGRERFEVRRLSNPTSNPPVA